ncbi:hypothetical protein AS9A_2826 [Hoyosella subflava DQS3-9A1]|uniref:PLD phosphodiesterase domain-containing protein n=1 Tax=Hoyosella subflava (strain DSM 45089 / JCM 17490 / NBRC 109087 / DQS3-9A1) TaxID=443218 RepID=F6EJ41_HOYSD|nr:hypothetical protein AS9A_2826 [Hoyosella subflava DQS3-9A1]
MNNENLGREVTQLAEGAAIELVLCAPFIKLHVIERLMKSTKEGVCVAVITRWRPEEIAAGVSDPEILSVIEDRGGKVLLHDRLHAKFYRNEAKVLVGSANLTGAALGWSNPSNVELLTSVSAEVVADLECRLQAESVRATPQIATAVSEAAAQLKPLSAAVAPAVGEAWAEWLPRLRQPSDLFTAYSLGAERLSTASASAAKMDLAMLDLPPGLDRQTFTLIVGSRLLQAPSVMAVDEYLLTPRRFGAVVDWIARRHSLDRDCASNTWQTLMRWLLEFLPDRYGRNVPGHSEIIDRKGSR